MTPRTYQLADLFEAVAATVPDRIALVDGDRRHSFREVDERASRLANHLSGLGLEPDAKVAIYSWNRAEWIESMLACFKARLVPININYRYVAAELAYVLDNADIEAVIHERGFAPLLDEVAPDLTHRIVLEDGSEVAATGVGYEAVLAARSPVPAVTDRSNDDLYILYTGGTTGMPKGVVWRHEDIFFAAMGGNGLGEGPVQSPAEVVDRIRPPETQMVSLALPPLMHGAAQWFAFITLLSGGTFIIYTDHHFDADLAWKITERERVNQISIVGDAMARPLADALDAAPGAYDLSSMFAIGSGGAIFSSAVKTQLSKHLPDVLLIDSFGASETGAGGQQFDVAGGPTFPASPWIAVLDEHLEPVEPGSGAVGKIARRGHVPLAYYKDEAKTAATFITDAHGVRWAIPGDHGTVEADGSVTLLGRGSGCINSGGEKIYPEEVEAALKAHPDVFDAVVVGVADDRFGQRVAAIVEPRPGLEPTLDDLATHCRTLIAGYKVPRELRLVDAMHRKPNGKADYAWATAQVEAARR